MGQRAAPPSPGVSAPAAGPSRHDVTASLALAAVLLLGLCALGRWAAPQVALVPGWEAGIDGTLAGLGRWRVTPAAPDTLRAVLFGDSLTRCGEDLTIGQTLWPALAAAGRRVEHVDVFGFAMRPLPFAYLGADVAAATPGLAIIEVNPGNAWPAQPPAIAMRYHPLSRRLRPNQIWALRAALTGDGLSWFAPSVYRLEHATGLLYVVDGVQDAWRNTVRALELPISAALGHPAGPLRGFVAQGTRRGALPGPLAAHQATIALADLRRTLRAAGVRVLFYVAPRPPADRREPREQLEAFEPLRIAVGAAPDEWLDLSAAIPADGFRDAVGHLHAAGCTTVGGRIAAALRPAAP